MGRKSKKKSAAPVAAHPDEMVERTLRKLMTDMYGKADGWTDEKVQQTVNGDIELMQGLGYCSYVAIQDAAALGEFKRLSPRAHYFETAMEALENLHSDAAFISLVEMQQSMQGNQKQPPSTHKETMCTGSSEKLQQTTAISGKNDKPQTVAECNKLTLESTKPLLARGQVVKIGEASDKLMQQALAKAKAEMKQNFCFESLCAQGQQLYHLVLQDKTRRFYSKLKHRSKWKLKKKGSLSPDN